MTKDKLKDYVGQAPFAKDRFYDSTPPGVVMGLAWTAMGGATLYVEAAKVQDSESKGGLVTTGAGARCALGYCLARLAIAFLRAACQRAQGPGSFTVAATPPRPGLHATRKRGTAEPAHRSAPCLCAVLA